MTLDSGFRAKNPDPPGFENDEKNWRRPCGTAGDG